MDPPSSDVPKLPDMVMCGDHPSFTKTELNVKETKSVKDEPKEKPPMSYARISPTSSRTERVLSEHVLRTAARLRAPERRRDDALAAAAAAAAAGHNRALVQAALGSFRWPPYLLCVWVVVLVVTHLLHCLVSLLESAAPNFKKLCQYFRAWTEESWKEKELNARLVPLALACATAALYAAYAALCLAHALAAWATQPLCPDDQPETDLKVTDYVDDVPSKTNSAAKH